MLIPYHPVVDYEALNSIEVLKMRTGAVKTIYFMFFF